MEYKHFEILGIYKDKLVCLEEINDFTGCGESKGQVHIQTMRPLTQNQIDNAKDEDNLKDFWIEAVKGGYTEDSLSDWVEQAIDEAEGAGLYFPFDDDSGRYDVEIALNNAKDGQKVRDWFMENINGFVDFECSSFTHLDSMLKKNKNLFSDFQYTTQRGKEIIPQLVKFVEGKIDFDNLKTFLEE